MALLPLLVKMVLPFGVPPLTAVSVIATAVNAMLLSL
jgi:hypothetical protein